MHRLLPRQAKGSTVIVGVSPDQIDKLSAIVPKVKAKTGGAFDILLLSDSQHETIDGYGLLNETAAKRGRFLPHPTTYVIDEEGIVRWKFTEKDYKVRPTNEMILRELKKLR